MFASKQIPSVGVSIGIERIFSLLEDKYNKSDNIRTDEADVLVASVGKVNLTSKRLEIVNQLWDAGIKAEILYEDIPKVDKQMNYALTNKITYVIFIGEDEIKQNKVKLKNLKTKEQTTIEIEKAIDEIKKRLKSDEYIISKNVLKKEAKSSKIYIEVFFKTYENIGYTSSIDKLGELNGNSN